MKGNYAAYKKHACAEEQRGLPYGMRAHPEKYIPSFIYYNFNIRHIIIKIDGCYSIGDKKVAKDGCFSRIIKKQRFRMKPEETEEPYTVSNRHYIGDFKKNPETPIFY
jgi:hypothetical protein